MIFHVDANSFYASCERLFRPDLLNKPVAVLSNNDGIIIALTKECKELGLKRGDPYFKVKDFCNIHGIAVFSSNYTMYADISLRLNSVYALFAESYEIYSIDESFLFFPDLKNLDFTALGHQIRKIVLEQIGIPVSVGIAPTKTLAKMCNKLAKKNRGVFNWAECNQEETLKNYRVEDIWGIGQAKSGYLKRNGIYDAFTLSRFPLDKAKKALTITGFYTVMELKGLQQIEQIERPRSKNICSSRSFQKCVYHFDELKEALCLFCENAISKMREENQNCSSLYVTLATAAPFSCEFDPEQHYFAGQLKVLSSPTSYLPEILEAAVSALKDIYRPGYGYRKTSVTLLNLKAGTIQPELFDNNIKEKLKQNLVMNAVDNLNHRFGKETIHPAAGRSQNSPEKENWFLKRELKSPDYTTDKRELPVAK